MVSGDPSDESAEYSCEETDDSRESVHLFAAKMAAMAPDGPSEEEKKKLFGSASKCETKPELETSTFRKHNHGRTMKSKGPRKELCGTPWSMFRPEQHRVHYRKQTVLVQIS
ncbi:uncharacterized protein V6R79_003758 [Siganus canaliculatus]